MNPAGTAVTFAATSGNTAYGSHGTETVYELVADVTRMPEFSPEIRRCSWLDGATGPAVGGPRG